MITLLMVGLVVSGWVPALHLARAITAAVL